MKKPSLQPKVAATLALMAYATSLFAGVADKTRLDSKISAVTVYSDRALVIRTATVRLDQGEQIVTFTDLPAEVQSDSIQVSGTGNATIKGVKFETIRLTDAVNSRLDALYDEQEKNEQAITAQEDVIDIAKKEKAFIENIAGKLTSPEEETASLELDPQKWISMIDFYRSRLTELQRTIRDTEKIVDQMEMESARIDGEISDLEVADIRKEQHVQVVLTVPEPEKVDLVLSYVVLGPGWGPEYDLRASTENRQLSVTYHGLIKQNTGEEWTDIRLSLSTAQLQISGRQPNLQPWYLSPALSEAPTSDSYDTIEAMMNQMMPARGEQCAITVAPSSVEPEKPELVLRTAEAKSTSTAVVFEIDGPSSIESDNELHKVAICRFEFPAHFRYSAVPKLIPHAYLKAKVTNGSGFPFLAGPSHVFLDKHFVCTSSMEHVAPDEEFWTFLGIDAGIEVSRKLVKEYESDQRVFGKKTKVVYSYLTTIINHNSDEHELVLWDQIPISTNESIEVALLEPDFKTNTDVLKKNEHDFLEWFFVLKPGQEVRVPLSFSVTYPTGQPISGLD